MADIKLSYFDARGRAELSRLILAYAGVRFSPIFHVQNILVGHCVTRSLNHAWLVDPWPFIDINASLT